ncbi:MULTISPECIES: MFS transporter [unclassified Aeromicrobium]|uniref:MFS transporter n=1 Tax=unclassified Aeromicrobium TaxID=2633570 RepID=UPI00396B0BB9
MSRSVAGSDVRDARRWASLAGICVAAAMVWLAFADLGVASPAIGDDFDAQLGALQWANNAFSLVTGALVIAAGRFGDVYGRRRMLLLGIAIFGACSVVSALAGSLPMLIAGRALMGVGAALVLPATLALIPPQFSGKEQLTAFGVWQAVAWGGQAVGPAVGGGLTDGLGWAWLFWINVPLAAVAFVVVARFTPESKDDGASSHVDWPGLVTIALAVFALLYALTEAPDVGWGSPLVIGMFVAAAVLAGAWCLIELRVADPLVDFRLFRLRAFDGALTANLMMNLAFGGLSYLLVLWLQNVRGFSAVEAGLLMLPSTLGIFCTIALGGRMDARRGSRLPVLIGLVVMSGGLLLLGTTSRTSSLWLMAAGLVVVGLGLGLLSTPISNTAVGNVPGHLAGTAAGVFKMSSMVGGAVGVALLTAMGRGFSLREWKAVATDAGVGADTIDELRAALVDSSSFADAIAALPRDVQDLVTQAVMTAFSDGVRDALVATGVLSLVVTAVVWLLWPRPASQPAGDESAQR